MTRLALHHGDCLAWLDTLDAGSVDAVVSDPPYHLESIQRRFARGKPASSSVGMARRCSVGFMGLDWDGGDIAHDPATWGRVLRVMKPGSWAAIFHHARTYHRLATALDAAGFEVRDAISWVYATGAPLGNLRIGESGSPGELGTRLKPSHELICMAMKPLEAGGFAKQIEATWTGGLRVGACRVASRPGDRQRYDLQPHHSAGLSGPTYGEWEASRTPYNRPSGGRFPPNFVASHPTDDAGHDACAGGCVEVCPVRDLGEQSRCFPAFRFSAKPSVSERELGLDDFEPLEFRRVNAGGLEREERFAPTQRRNIHATVKPVSLMRWLCRLVTPAGGLVVDPFLGSGTTGMAAMWEGLRFAGCELLPRPRHDDPDHFAIAEARIRHAMNNPPPEVAVEPDEAEEGQGLLWG